MAMGENQPLLILNPAKNAGFYRHPLTTLLSVIDEDPHEDEYEDIDGCESRRQSINSEFRHHNWKFGLIMALLSGVFFTATSIMIQFFQVNATELLLVRSIFQAIILGLVAASSPYRVHNNDNNSLNWRVKMWIFFQAILGALKLYLTFACLQFLPLGDAITIMFIEPLFTVILSFMFLNVSVGFIKILLCFGLLAGMAMSVQPPFLFGQTIIMDMVANVTEQIDEENQAFSDDYYTGVTMALGCAVLGALCNILINQCKRIRSTVLVFFAGLGGIAISIMAWMLDYQSEKILLTMEHLEVFDWAILSMISLIGILAIFAMTAALKMVSPTSVSVLRALEIILAFLFQIIVMHQIPNGLCIAGAAIVSLCILGISLEERYNLSPNFPRPTVLTIGRTVVFNS